MKKQNIHMTRSCPGKMLLGNFPAMKLLFVATNQMSFPINPAAGGVFYRLLY